MRIIEIASNPEFPARGIPRSEDFKRPDRVVIRRGNTGALRRRWVSALIVPRCILRDKRRSSNTSPESPNSSNMPANHVSFLATKINSSTSSPILCEKGLVLSSRTWPTGIDWTAASDQKISACRSAMAVLFSPRITESAGAFARDVRCAISIVDTVTQSMRTAKEAMARKIIDACGRLMFSGKNRLRFWG